MLPRLAGWLVTVLVAACGHAPAPASSPSPIAPTPPPAPTADAVAPTEVVAKHNNKPGASDEGPGRRPRNAPGLPLPLPRPPPPATPPAGTRLGFDPTAWRVDGARSIAFCPHELVVVDDHDGVHRVDLGTGHERAALQVKGAAAGRLVECRADGSALVVAAGRAVLIGPEGAARSSPIEVIDARFADEGVRLLTADALMVWDGTRAPAEIGKVAPAALSTLVTGGAYLHGDDPHATLERPGKPPLALGEFAAGLEGVTAAPDGTLVGLVDRRMHAIAFGIERDVAKRTQIWEQIGMGLQEVRISNRWIAVLATPRDLILRARPSLVTTRITTPCAGELALAIAVSEDRVAVGCEHGLRVFELPSRTLIARADAPHVALAWSGDGARLASREDQGRIDIWEGARHISTIDAEAGALLWWRGGDLVGIGLDKLVRRLVVWKHGVPPVTAERTELTIDAAAATPRGDTALLAARWERPNQRAIPMLALDVRGAITALPIPTPEESSVVALAISPDGKRGVAIRDVGDVPSLLLVDIANHRVTPSDVRADAIAIGNTQIAVAQGFKVLELDGPVLAEMISPVVHLAYTVDGKHLAVATRDGRVEIVGGARWLGDGSEIAAITWSPDGAQLAIATQTATYLWRP